MFAPWTIADWPHPNQREVDQFNMQFQLNRSIHHLDRNKCHPNKQKESSELAITSLVPCCFRVNNTPFTHQPLAWVLFLLLVLTFCLFFKKELN